MNARSELFMALGECFTAMNEHREGHQQFLDATSSERLQMAQAAGVPIGTLVSAFHDLKRDGFDLRQAAHLVNYILLAAIAGKQEQST